MKIMRCGWVSSDPLYEAYHDDEWGIPVYDGQKLFEMICLEGAQAGLSWITVLRKREHYRKVFDGFDVQRIAQYEEKKIEELLQDPGIIRHRGKIEAFIKNAQAYLLMEKNGENFSEFIWSFVREKPIINHWESYKDISSSSPESDAMSKALKKRGFKFVGSTICYAFMQAAGLVDDHEEGCFKRRDGW